MSQIRILMNILQNDTNFIRDNVKRLSSRIPISKKFVIVE